MTDVEIMTAARRRKVFTTENPEMLEKCLALKRAGLFSGGKDAHTVTANFRLTRKGHEMLREAKDA